MFRKKTKKGFTIVELVIVIAVIAILSAVLIPTFAGLIKKANISADQTLVRNLNTSLAISSEGGGTKNSTMYQTLEAMKGQGYVVDKLTPTHSKNNIVWDSENNQFVLVYENGETFTGTTVDPTVDKSKMWKVYTEIPTESEYSVYLAGTNVTGNVEVKGVGFDAGENVGISTVTYKNEPTVAKDVVIRTNGGTLTVNAPADTVNHYGEADSVNIVAVASESYHENGTVPFLQISKGRIELEAKAEVNGIHVANVQTVGENGEITKTENTFSHDVVLSLNGADVKLTRDTIGTEIATPVLVCEVQANANSNEFIWLVGDGTIENAKVYVTETKTTPDTSVASTTTTENASAAAIAIANNAVNTGSEENPAYTAVDTGVKLNTSEDQEIWATYDSQVKLEYLINNTTFTNLKQVANITNITTVEIPQGRVINIDLNGFTIDAALKSTGRHYYALYNYGTLTLQDSSEDGTSYIKARGIENLGGKMTINSGKYYNIDTNGGAAVWNDSDGIKYMLKADVEAAKAKDQNYYDTDLGISISKGSYTVVDSLEGNYAVVGSDRNGNNNNPVRVNYYKNMDGGDLTINGGEFIVEYVGSSSDSSGPGVINSQAGTKLTINGGTFTSSSMRVYTIIADGETVINDCNVTGAHGALAIDAGTAIVNGGTFVCTQYYGCWITNDGTDTRVTINGGSFSGKYGVYSSVDDGGQDESNVAITINGGTFEGTSGSAVINDKATQNQFALMIYGGKFNSNPSTYVSTSYTITEDNGWFVVTK